MSNLNIALIGPPEFGKELGKKGTSTDITFYNLKKGENTLTLIEPSRYPEKLSSLYYTASLADVAVVVIDAITPALGECILMLNCAHVMNGYLILRNYLDRGQIAPLIKGTVLEGYTELADDVNVIREHLLTDANLVSKKSTGKAGIVPIDHHFNVKGIGTVILGCVTSGEIAKHDQVLVYPLGKSVQIRSIQKHDDDVGTAQSGDRVGVALKGIESDELDRGYVLCADKDLHVRGEISGKADIIPYWPEPLKEQMVLYVGHWMQFLPCRVTSVSGDDWRRPVLTLSFEKELIFPTGGEAILHYLEGEKLRIVGTVRLS